MFVFIGELGCSIRNAKKFLLLPVCGLKIQTLEMEKSFRVLIYIIVVRIFFFFFKKENLQDETMFQLIVPVLNYYDDNFP